jgi:hypothetical protein
VSLHTASKNTQKHEYHFLNHQIPIFHTPAVQIYFFKKIQVNIKKLKYIPKSHQKVPNSNICFYTIYKDYRKKFENKIKKIFLPRVFPDTRQREPLPSARLRHSAKKFALPSA